MLNESGAVRFEATPWDGAITLPQPTREQVTQIQSELAAFPQVELTPKHYFAEGMCVRELFIPAETLVVGKIHRHQHVVSLLSGRCRINTDKGVEDITGPHTWISPAGAKRALRTYTDCLFLTCHATDETDLDALEAEIIEPEPCPFLAHEVSP